MLKPPALRAPTLRALPPLFLALALGACAAPRAGVFFQPSPAEIGPLLDNDGEAVIPRHGMIVVEGDDLVYATARQGGRPGINGSDVGRAPVSITEAMRPVLPGVEIVNRGYPGDSIVTAAKRWAGLPAGNLEILSFGFGDAMARTPLGTYTAELTAMIRRAHAQGASVFVILSPPVTDKRLGPLLSSYQTAARTVALDEGAAVFDPVPEMAKHKLAYAKGVPQAPMTYRAIAGAMVPYIRPVQVDAAEPASPQTGQAGSGATPTVRVSAASAS